MSFTPDLVVYIFFVQLFAYTIKGLVGFGNPLISSPLLAMRLDNLLITPGTLITDIPMNAYISWKNHKSVQWRKILPLVVFNVLGSFPGVFLLRVSMPWVIKTVLGVVVVFLGVEMATRNRKPSHQARDLPWMRLVVAFLSGICAGLFGINMFLAAYLQRVARDYSEFKGSICILFLSNDFFRLFTYAANGLMTKDTLLFSCITAPALLLAILIGSLLAPRLDEKKLQKGAIFLFIAGGISIIVKSLIFHT